MSEFVNRMDAQRRIIELVNRSTKGKSERIYGLSKDAIVRWLNKNGIDVNGNIASILFEISMKLFFLSNKSQEQVTEEYKALSLDISDLEEHLKLELAQQ